MVCPSADVPGVACVPAEGAGPGRPQSVGQPRATALYDIVLASEVLEHVKRPDLFCATLYSVLRPGGVLVVSTLNRTPASFALAIVAAEYVAGVVPRGTHDWTRFITPEELHIMAGQCGMAMTHAAGMWLEPGSGHFRLTGDLSFCNVGAVGSRRQ
ncbi:polyprenyldihydroxybenzoate methyltransferase [Haematococcus lacustris]|uniref:Polyprenyldihydroxybenzoate methyltransferase n=1 Tax=Haematococcus lacustris TaxID=44745 RepID=A0A699ZTU7_HAELA|nr:polyprenyldihydroxybenzoate methyltransferase [Haematococcus lacustris]